MGGEREKRKIRGGKEAQNGKGMRKKGRGKERKERKGKRKEGGNGEGEGNDTRGIKGVQRMGNEERKEGDNGNEDK